MTTCLEAARMYRALGLHPIPCEPRGKRPLVEWKPYQDEPPHLDEIEAWWAQTPDANVGLVMGRGIFAVDFDGGAEAEALLERRGVRLPPGPRSRTGKGFHVFLSADGRVADRVRLAWDGRQAQVDVRGVGFVVVPPSIHPTGAQYAWEIPLTLPLPPAPPELLRLLDVKPEPTAPGQAPIVASEHGWVGEALRGVQEGARDQTCTRLAGYFIGKGIDAATTEALLVQSFARNCIPPFEVSEIRKVVQSIATRHGTNGTSPQEIVPVKLSAVLDSLTAALHSSPPKMIQTPFSMLNHFLAGGFGAGELVYIGARPGVGKTALALEIARHAARDGETVLVVSREMINMALARRLLAQTARVSASSLKSGRIGDGEWIFINQALPKLRDLPLWLTDQAIHLEEIERIVERFTPSPSMLIVDYLQLVRAPADIKDRRLQVEAVSQALKTLAVRRSIPVLCLSSLARLQGGSDAEPILASLRESGELEHDADIVILLHRKRMAQETKCIVAKNRDGREGTTHLLFRAEHTAFEEASDRQEG